MPVQGADPADAHLLLKKMWIKLVLTAPEASSVRVPLDQAGYSSLADPRFRS